MADGFVTNYGNDDNDGLTWETAKRSLQGAADAGFNIQHIKGLFNETLVNNYKYIGYGNTILDFRFISYAHSQSYLTSIDIRNIGGQSYKNAMINCIITNNAKIIFGFDDAEFSVLNNTDFAENASYNYNNITAFRCLAEIVNSVFNEKDSIYAECNIEVKSKYINFSLFINSQFKFTGGAIGTDETTFEYPTGATDTAKLQNLGDRMAIVYGGLASDYLVGCKYYSGSYNDVFVDADNGDFNLVPFCIAAHMSYDGDYIGARPEGTKAEWNTDFSSIVNIDANGNVIDQTIDASAETNIIDIGHERDVLNFQALGQRAARNGQQVNTETNLGSNIAAGSSVLTDGSIYECVDDTIVRDDSGSTGQNPWETFTAVDEGSGVGLGFLGDGEVKEVYIDDRYEEKVQFKSSKTDGALSTAVLITSKLHSDPVLVNVDGNGEPTHGDADVGYVEGTAIPLRSRYIQFFILIKANNLPAR